MIVGSILLGCLIVFLEIAHRAPWIEDDRT